ncbi:hypothetical protein SCATT_p17050 (plasmid) [Streptantibioticus cattleyicolor NRRL 8057 = DSM 46488]|uniref:Uncharacterized protein n=1 Tax=Streptantibioticus cattleyicolor (strain ATCC 35852 / DSM 46488 / JCM 4925 / NBRC 14057 / NRRL 8057) TaxID=1003195 RepID=G8XHZ2_STREN|nr:hypothetical protein SCATT_p17050 [Streptantibioticus cattleyicolor NRRL 8057 = DSM 46488]
MVEDPPVTPAPAQAGSSAPRLTHPDHHPAARRAELSVRHTTSLE